MPRIGAKGIAMKIGKLRSQWISIKLVLITADICVRALVRSLFGKMNRQWTDKTIQQWSTRILDQIGVTLSVHNPNNIEIGSNTPYIIMCNHSSLYDIPISFKAFPTHSVRMLAKKELSQIPMLKKAMTASEFPFIDRKNRKQAIKDLAYASELMKSGIILWVAPEGTRSKDGKLAPFKKGAFITAIHAKAKIVPIGIRGAFNILPARTKKFNLNQHAEIHIGKIFDASLYDLETKEQLIQLVHDEMKQLCGE